MAHNRRPISKKRFTPVFCYKYWFSGRGIFLYKLFHSFLHSLFFSLLQYFLCSIFLSNNLMFYKSVFYFNIWLKNIVMYCGCKIITKRLVFHQSPFFFIPVVFFRNAVLSCDHLLLIRRKFSWLMSGRFFVDHFLFRLVFFRARKSAPSSALRWAQMRQSPFCRADLAKARADAKHTQTPNTSRFSPQWERAAWFASLGSSKKREKRDENGTERERELSADYFTWQNI